MNIRNGPICLSTAGDPARPREGAEINVYNLRSTFLFHELYELQADCQPVLSMGQLSKEECDFLWEIIDGIRGMRIHAANDYMLYIERCTPSLRRQIKRRIRWHHANRSAATC